MGRGHSPIVGEGLGDEKRDTLCGRREWGTLPFMWKGRGPALGTTFPGPSCGASPSPTAPATSSRPSPSHPWRGTPRKASSTCVTPPRAQKAPLPPPPEQRGSRPPTTPAGYVHPCQHLLYAPGHYGALQAWEACCPRILFDDASGWALHCPGGAMHAPASGLLASRCLYASHPPRARWRCGAGSPGAPSAPLGGRASSLL
ncbi:ADP-ribosylation factor-like protein 2 isoform X1 [Alligator mississippiensis]|uniref:ADP-ribosylation factor-like protein 2 isoform X1 n=1 Tax=Alligator mississippiensis TaxID=8496 RepID=UPI0028775250|nr:ADP-ribosylation factor-like protein 2 isoform X1 [Alligator mississippiensis]